MSDYRQEADDAAAAAFGRTRNGDSHSVEEFDRQLARTFGREADADVRLREELVEAGLTQAGAKGVVSWLDDFGASPEDAARLGSGFNGVQPGKVDSLVHERAEAILKRHRGGNSGSIRESAEDTSNVDKARAELVEAHATRNRAHYADQGFAQRMAEAHVKGEVGALQEWSVREGWSQEQMVARIRESTRRVQSTTAKAFGRQIKES